MSHFMFEADTYMFVSLILVELDVRNSRTSESNFIICLFQHDNIHVMIALYHPCCVYTGL